LNNLKFLKRRLNKLKFLLNSSFLILFSPYHSFLWCCQSRLLRPTFIRFCRCGHAWNKEVLLPFWDHDKYFRSLTHVWHSTDDVIFSQAYRPIFAHCDWKHHLVVSRAKWPICQFHYFMNLPHRIWAPSWSPTVVFRCWWFTNRGIFPPLVFSQVLISQIVWNYLNAHQDWSPFAQLPL